MKKLLLFIALTIFGLGLNAQSVGDETTIDYDGYSQKFKITSVEPAECEASYCTGEPIGVTIPSTVTISGTEFAVTSIGDYAFSRRRSLTSIEIPNSVTSIGGWAFSDCSSLTSIEIPSSVTSIGSGAFNGCSSLTSIEIPNSVTSIGSGAFSDCSSLTSIEIPNSVTSIGGTAFSDCSSLTSIEIPNSVTSIGRSAFSGCSSLTSIVVAEGNTVYDSRENCNAIIETSSNTLIAGCQNTVIPNSVTSIGSSAFEDCSSLTSIEIPNSVTSIGYSAFSGCSSLRVIKCHAENVPETEYDVFYGCSYGIIICVPENSVEDYKAEYPWNNYHVMSEISVIEYDGYSLIYIITDEENTECMVACAQDPTMPTSITIPSSVEIKGIEFAVTSIGSGAFSYCSSLTSIEIPNSVTSIGSSAFSYCSSLTSIEIPNSVTSIGSSAFYDCSSLTSITFGDNPQLTSIGDGAFYDCDGLTSIEIPNSVTFIGDYAFYSCSSLASVTFEENSQFTSIGKNAFSGCSSLTSIEIPNSVTSIGDWAFEDCSSLTSIEIPNSVTSISSSAFSGCSSLTSIEIPNSVTSIGSGAFSDCSSLTSIEIPNSVTSIGDWAFSGCSSLTSIEIPSSVTSIGSYAFSGCSSLTSIEIPNSVTSIGNKAFRDCSSLRVIKCYADNVPETGDNVFNYCPSDMIILVPSSSLSEYQSKSPWNEYKLFVISEVSIIDYDGYSLIYAITDLENAECKVACAIKPKAPTTLTIPSNVMINETSFTVTSIPDSAFLECNKFTGDLVIPNTVKSVGIRAFRDCTGFTGSLTLSENLETIGDLAFAGGGDIEVNYTGDLIIPNSVTSIGWAAFQNCSSLTSVTFGEDSQLTSIGESAFYDCSKLTGDLTIPNSVTYIGSNAFRNCSSLTGDLTIPNGVTYIGQSAFWECVGLDGTLTLPENLDTIHDYTFGSYYSTMALTGNVVIPETVKYIGSTAFQNCSSLENVTFGENSQLTYIGDYAFTNCNSLASIEIPSGVTYIGQYGLNCSSLKVIKCYAEDVPETDETAFKECPSNMKIYVPEKSLNSYKSKQPWKDFLLRPLGESINELLSSSINIYPNPVENDLFIATEMNVKEVAIYDVYGRQTMSLQVNETTSQQVVEVADLEAGVYFVKVVTNAGEIVKRFVKK